MSVTSGTSGGKDQKRLEEWIRDVPELIDRLHMVFVPGGLPYGYPPEALNVLEAALVEQYGPEGGPPEASGFVEAAMAYVGEILMITGGGRWAWDENGPAAAGGQPVVTLGEELGLAPVPVLDLITRAVAERSGRVFEGEHARIARAVDGHRSRHPGWEPLKAHTPGVDPSGEESQDAWLAQWLRERVRAFPAWAKESGQPPESWDFTPDSLDRLERLVRQRYATVEAFKADQDGPFLTGASWYLGEVIRRHTGANWSHWAVVPGAPPGSGHHPDDPWAGQTVIHQPHRRDGHSGIPGSLLRELIAYGEIWTLRERYDDFA